MANDQDSYNKGGLIAFIFSMGFSTLFIIYISFIHKGVQSIDTIDEQKAAPVEVQTQAAADPALPAGFDVNKVEKIWVASPALEAYGKTVFKTNCAVCHGDTYLGDGPAGKAIVPPPRNLVEGKWKQGGRTQDLFKTLQGGIVGTSMASFSHLPKNDRWALVHMIRSITKNKPKDDPKELEKFAATAN